MQDPRPSTLGQAHGVVSKLAERLLSRGQRVTPAASLVPQHEARTPASINFQVCNDFRFMDATSFTVGSKEIAGSQYSAYNRL